MPDTALKTDLSVEQIVQDFGDFYIDAGQSENNIHQLPFEEFGTQSAFTTVPTNDTAVRETLVELSEVLQPFQDEFTPKGGVEFKPVTTILHKVKIDQEFNPHKLQRSYLGFLASNNTDVTTWPFIRWFIEKYLMGQAKEDIEMNGIYKGVRKEPNAGTPGDAIDSMDGLEIQMNNAITAGSIVPITLGALSTDPVTFVEQIESFVKSIPEKYRYMAMELNLNRTLRDRYKSGIREKYKMHYAPGDVSPATVVDFENISVMGRASMMGKNRIFCSPKYNLPFYVKGFENVNGFQVEKAKRNVAVFTEFWVAPAFINPELVFCSDGDVE